MWCSEEPHCRMAEWTALKMWRALWRALSGLGRAGPISEEVPAAREARAPRSWRREGLDFMAVGAAALKEAAIKLMRLGQLR